MKHLIKVLKDAIGLLIALIISISILLSILLPILIPFLIFVGFAAKVLIMSIQFGYNIFF